MKITDKKLKILIENEDRIKFSEDRHEYKINGIKTPSVTTLLKEGGLASNFDFVDPLVLEKARMRGDAIHFQIEDALKNEDYYEMQREGDLILDYLACNFNKGKKTNFKNIISEGKIYSGNLIKPFCGRFDLLAKNNESGEFYLLDIKSQKSWSGSSENYTRWQLSLYAYALREYDIKVDHLIILKFKYAKIKDEGGNSIEWATLDPLEVNFISDEKIETFLKGEPINKELITFSKNEIDIFKELKAKEEELKNLQNRVDTIKKALYSYMLDNDILKAETEDGTIKITRTKESEVVSVDKARLEIEEPAIFAKYKKVSKRDGYVKITIK